MNRPFQDMCSAHNSAHSFLLPVHHHHLSLLPRFQIHPIIIGRMLEHAGAGGRERGGRAVMWHRPEHLCQESGEARVKYMQHTFKHKPGEGRGAQKAVPCH